MLPATANSVARYLADHAESLALNTLKQRLAGLAAWHREQGFPDPTRAPQVRKVLRGIGELHPHIEKRAQPLQIAQLHCMVEQLEKEIQSAPLPSLRALRDRALLLLGFWRAFRSDELARIEVQNVSARPGKGMEILLPRTKTDYGGSTRRFRAPALKALCPVDAWVDWVTTAGIAEGPAFQAINRWGHLSGEPLHPASIIGMIKRIAKDADIPEHEQMTSHSLRRGFATWANSHQWDTRSLMEYVGWRDVRSAMRYIDSPDPFQSLSLTANPPETTMHKGG